MKKGNKKLIKVIKGNLDSILSASNKIAEEWDRKTIPLSELSKMLDILASADLGTDNPALQEFQEAYVNMLDTLHDTCKNKAKTMDSDSIPISYLSLAIGVLKKSLDKTVK